MGIYIVTNFPDLKQYGIVVIALGALLYAVKEWPGGAQKDDAAAKEKEAAAAQKEAPVKQEKKEYQYQLIPVDEKGTLLGELNSGFEFVGETSAYVIIRTPKSA